MRTPGVTISQRLSTSKKNESQHYVCVEVGLVTSREQEEFELRAHMKNPRRHKEFQNETATLLAVDNNRFGHQALHHAGYAI